MHPYTRPSSYSSLVSNTQEPNSAFSTPSKKLVNRLNSVLNESIHRQLLSSPGKSAPRHSNGEVFPDFEATNKKLKHFLNKHSKPTINTEHLTKLRQAEPSRLKNYTEPINLGNETGLKPNYTDEPSMPQSTSSMTGPISTIPVEDNPEASKNLLERMIAFCRANNNEKLAAKFNAQKQGSKNSDNSSFVDNNNDSINSEPVPMPQRPRSQDAFTQSHGSQYDKQADNITELEPSLPHSDFPSSSRPNSRPASSHPLNHRQLSEEPSTPPTNASRNSRFIKPRTSRPASKSSRPTSGFINTAPINSLRSDLSSTGYPYNAPHMHSIPSTFRSASNNDYVPDSPPRIRSPFNPSQVYSSPQRRVNSSKGSNYNYPQPISKFNYGTINSGGTDSSNRVYPNLGQTDFPNLTTSHTQSFFSNPVDSAFYARSNAGSAGPATEPVNIYDYESDEYEERNLGKRESLKRKQNPNKQFSPLFKRVKIDDTIRASKPTFTDPNPNPNPNLNTNLNLNTQSHDAVMTNTRNPAYDYDHTNNKLTPQPNRIPAHNKTNTTDAEKWDETQWKKFSIAIARTSETGSQSGVSFLERLIDNLDPEMRSLPLDKILLRYKAWVNCTQRNTTKF